MEPVINEVDVEAMKTMNLTEQITYLTKKRNGLVHEERQAKEAMTVKLRADETLAKLVEELKALDFTTSVIVGGYDVSFSPVKTSEGSTKASAERPFRVTGGDEPTRYYRSIKEAGKSEAEAGRLNIGTAQFDTTFNILKTLKANEYVVEGMRHDTNSWHVR